MIQQFQIHVYVKSCPQYSIKLLDSVLNGPDDMQWLHVHMTHNQFQFYSQLTSLISSADIAPGRSCLLAKTSSVAPANLCKSNEVTTEQVIGKYRKLWVATHEWELLFVLQLNQGQDSNGLPCLLTLVVCHSDTPTTWRYKMLAFSAFRNE